PGALAAVASGAAFQPLGAARPSGLYQRVSVRARRDDLRRHHGSAAGCDRAARHEPTQGFDMSSEELHPEEFAQAADAAIADALSRQDPHAMAAVLAQAGLCGVMADEADGGLGLDLAFALPIAHAAGRLQLPL